MCYVASLNFFKVAGSPISENELDFERGLFYSHFEKSLKVNNLTYICNIKNYKNILNFLQFLKFEVYSDYSYMIL